MARDPDASSKLAAQKAASAASLAAQKSAAASMLAQEKAAQAGIVAAQKSAAASMLAQERAAQQAILSAQRSVAAARIQQERSVQQAILTAQKNAAAQSAAFDKRQHDMALARVRTESAAKVAATRAVASKGGGAGAGGAGGAPGEDGVLRAMTRKKALLATLSVDQINFANAVKGAGGPLGSMASKVEDVAAIMGQAGGAMKGIAVVGANALVAVVMALVAAAVAATAAMIALTIAVTSYAMHAADAARSSNLLNEAAAAGAKDHGELTMVINDIATRVPLAKAKIAEFGRALEIAGLQGRRMQVALESISMIESAIPGAGAKVQELVERFQKLRRAVLTKQDLLGTGLVIDDVAAALANLNKTSVAAAKSALANGTAGVDAVMAAMQAAIEKKFGKTIAAQMMSLSVQFEKLKENIAGLFSGLNLEAFLSGLKMVTDMFSQSTVTGQALKSIMTGIFQGIFDTMTKVFPYVRMFFLGFLIGALQVYIAIKPVLRIVGELLGGGSNKNGLAMALMLGKMAAYALAAGLVIAAVSAIVLAAALLVIAVLLSPIAIILGVIALSLLGLAIALMLPVIAVMVLLAAVGYAVYSILDYFGVMNSAGGGLIDGFVDGINAKMGDVIAAVTAIGAAAEGALRAALGWNSPATLGIDAATSVGEGMEVGADKAEGKASDAIGGIIGPNGAKDAVKKAKSDGSAKVLYIENLHVSSEDDRAKFIAMMRAEFGFEEGT